MNTKIDHHSSILNRIIMETSDILINKVLYSVGETFVVIGLFITIVGLVTMIYSYTPEQKVDFLPV